MVKASVQGLQNNSRDFSSLRGQVWCLKKVLIEGEEIVKEASEMSAKFRQSYYPGVA